MEKKSIFWMNALFLMASVAFAIWFNNPWILMIGFISLIVLICLKMPFKYFIGVIWPLTLVVAIYIIFVPRNANLKALFGLIEPTLQVRTKMMDYIGSIYSREPRDFIYMLLFNQKDNSFYKSLIDLNVAHLFVISGLHISIFCGIIDKLIKKKPISLTINILFTCFIFYMTQFSISILRVMITLIVGVIVRKKELDSFIRTCITGMVMLVLFPTSCMNMSYILTIMCTLFITYVINETESHWLQFVLINFVTSLVIMPITISFNNKVNVLYFLNNLLFSDLIIVIYYFELLFCWIPFMVPMNTTMIHYIKIYMIELSNLQAFFKLKIKPIDIIIIYAFAFSGWNYYEYKQNIKKPCNILYNKMYANNN